MIKFPRIIRITNDYGKTWDMMIFKQFYNTICIPLENRPSCWIFNEDDNIIISWNYLQYNQNYNCNKSYTKRITSIRSIKEVIVKILICIRLKIYLYNEAKFLTNFKTPYF